MSGSPSNRRQALWCLPGLLTVVLGFTPSDVAARKNAHGDQGTGNYKGKRDRHEKPGPGNEKKKRDRRWRFLRK